VYAFCGHFADTLEQPASHHISGAVVPSNLCPDHFPISIQSKRGQIMRHRNCSTKKKYFNSMCFRVARKISAEEYQLGMDGRHSGLRIPFLRNC